MVVAERLGRFDTIGIDCIAMNVNDLICVGAEPIAMLDFILCSRPTRRSAARSASGLRRGAELAGVEIPGGRDRPGRRRRLGLGADRRARSGSSGSTGSSPASAALRATR